MACYDVTMLVKVMINVREDAAVIRAKTSVALSFPIKNKWKQD